MGYAREIKRLLAAVAICLGATAAADEPGEFDYYVLALSWNAAWCAAEGDARDAPQCDSRHDHGFLLHGLWPQHERGWPENCRRTTRDPSRAETGAMADIFGSAGLAWHQWKKHGRCSGLEPEAYFAAARAAYAAVRRPGLLRQVDRRLSLDPDVIEAAFLEANPSFQPDGVTVICRDRTIREVRICLTKRLEPRVCTGRTRQDCPLDAAIFEPMR